MNDNYLWDRTGEPDPEIQELENLLGELRYQPQPFEIPAHITVARRRPFFLPLTIAAAIIMVAILSALWVHFSRTSTSPAPVSRKEAPAPLPPGVKESGPTPDQKSLVVNKQPGQQRPRQMPRNVVAAYRPKAPRIRTSPPQLTPQEQAEKEQVLVALRLVSAKLNLAQRKTQGLPAPNTIRNQHKIG